MPVTQRVVLFGRTLSNWVYEFDKWAPTVVKVSYKVSYVAALLLREMVSWVIVTSEHVPDTERFFGSRAGKFHASGLQLR